MVGQPAVMAHSSASQQKPNHNQTNMICSNSDPSFGGLANAEQLPQLLQKTFSPQHMRSSTPDRLSPAEAGIYEGFMAMHGACPLPRGLAIEMAGSGLRSVKLTAKVPASAADDS